MWKGVEGPLVSIPLGDSFIFLVCILVDTRLVIPIIFSLHWLGESGISTIGQTADLNLWLPSLLNLFWNYIYIVFIVSTKNVVLNHRSGSSAPQPQPPDPPRVECEDLGNEDTDAAEAVCADIWQHLCNDLLWKLVLNNYYSLCADR